MFNVVKLQSQLKDLSDRQLAEQMQAGAVPEYLILAELQRRKKLRQEASSPNQAQQTSMAEEMGQEAIGGGITALPMEPPQFAEGGIVSFAGGGSVSPEALRRYGEEMARAFGTSADNVRMVQDEDGSLIPEITIITPGSKTGVVGGGVGSTGDALSGGTGKGKGKGRKGGDDTSKEAPRDEASKAEPAKREKSERGETAAKGDGKREAKGKDRTARDDSTDGERPRRKREADEGAAKGDAAEVDRPRRKRADDGAAKGEAVEGEPPSGKREGKKGGKAADAKGDAPPNDVAKEAALEGIKPDAAVVDAAKRERRKKAKEGE